MRAAPGFPRSTSRLLALCALALGAGAPAAAQGIVLPDEDAGYRAAEDPFTVPREMESRVRFWRDVYSKYSSGQIVLHDQENFDVVYAVLDETGRLGGAKTRKERDRAVEAEKERIGRVLRKLSDRDVRPADLTEEDLEIYAAVRKYAGWQGFVGRLRAQEGLAEQFKSGIEASRAYWDEIEAIFESYGLPRELARLCFVESLFRFDAYSKVGATGLWQFMRSTGKLYMTVNDHIDQRLDPIASTHAAAKLLQDNYRILGSWPLAVTAYNHGRGGMARAVAQTGSSDIVRIINRYQSPSFKFASKNFYASFLAAKEILGDPEKFFPDLSYASPARYDEFDLPRSAYLRDLSRVVGMTREELAACNPAWLRPITTDRTPIPAGTPVRVPPGKIAEVRRSVDAGLAVKARAEPPPRFEAALSKAKTIESEPAAEASGEPFAQHSVQSGDTLGSIARRHGVTVPALREANGLGRTDLLRAGQMLRIPGGETPTAIAEPSEPRRIAAKAPQAALPRSEPSRASVERRKAAVAPEQFILHRVLKGETIYKIAKSYRVTSKDIRAANGLSDDRIKVGQFLKIPRSS